ncbi:MAG: hypothetical protein A07HR60_02136 [uncultured archaeon A07HR60]|nr:MAG: hypothetical protein A07HR60_02136 [uncultured archaeon A07HR60]
MERRRLTASRYTQIIQEWWTGLGTRPETFGLSQLWNSYRRILTDPARSYGLIQVDGHILSHSDPRVVSINQCCVAVQIRRVRAVIRLPVHAGPQLPCTDVSEMRVNWTPVASSSPKASRTATGSGFAYHSFDRRSRHGSKWIVT